MGDVVGPLGWEVELADAGDAELSLGVVSDVSAGFVFEPAVGVVAEEEAGELWSAGPDTIGAAGWLVEGSPVPVGIVLAGRVLPVG